MGKIVKGDYVRFKSDIRLGRLKNVYIVIAVSDVYNMVRLRNRDTGFIISWYPASDVSRVAFFQPELSAR